MNQQQVDIDSEIDNMTGETLVKTGSPEEEDNKWRTQKMFRLSQADIKNLRKIVDTVDGVSDETDAVRKALKRWSEEL